MLVLKNEWNQLALDADGKFTLSRIPPVALTPFSKVASRVFAAQKFCVKKNTPPAFVK